MGWLPTGAPAARRSVSVMAKSALPARLMLRPSQTLVVVVITLLAFAWRLPGSFVTLMAGIGSPFTDFKAFAAAAGSAWGGGSPSAIAVAGCASCAFRHSPLVAYLFGIVAIAGPWTWLAAHFGALLALPARVGLLAVLLPPFWFDVTSGSNLIFVVVLAWHALGGGRWAIAGTLLLTLLVPRPLMLPISAWLLWRHPGARLPFAATAIASVVAVAILGQLGPWIIALTTTGPEMIAAYNIGPSHLVGAWWLPIGLALAGYLTLRGHVGWASVAISPYVLSYYLMVGLLELRRPYATAPPSAPRPQARERTA